ncbi:PD40 domain-containing protein [bacterium]|nr:PD40 domain-containing protein [bacterium]
MYNIGVHKKQLLILLFFVATTLVIIKLTAKEEIVEAHLLISPTPLSLSPSGEKLAFVTTEKNDSELTDRIQIMNTDGSNLQQITITHGMVNGSLAWSSDSKKIVFSVVDNEAKAIHVRIVDVQSLKDKEMTTCNNLDFTPRWSPDGNEIYFVRVKKDIHLRHKNNLLKEPSYPINLWRVNIDSNQEEQLTTTNDIYPLSWDWKQDGKRCFYLVTKGKFTEVRSVDIQATKEEKVYTLKGWGHGARFISCSPNEGNILFFRQTDLVKTDLWLLKADGSDKKKLSSKRCVLMPTWITDNQILTVDEKGGMWNFDIEKNQYKRLGLEVTSRHPVWGTKANKVFFVKGNGTIWAMDEDGSNPQRIYPAILSP